MLICPPIPPVNVAGIFGSTPRCPVPALRPARLRRCRRGGWPRRRQVRPCACHMNRFFQGTYWQRDVTANGSSSFGPDDVLHRDEAWKVGDQLVVTRREISEHERAAAVGHPVLRRIGSHLGELHRGSRQQAAVRVVEHPFDRPACGSCGLRRGACHGRRRRRRRSGTAGSTGRMPEGTSGAVLAAVGAPVSPDRVTTPTDTVTTAITATVAARMKTVSGSRLTRALSMARTLRSSIE